MEVKVLFPPNKEVADLQATICAFSMRSTRTKESSYELLEQFKKETVKTVYCQRKTDYFLVDCNCQTRAEMLVGSHTITGKCPYFDWCVERRLRDAKKMKHWGVFEFADFTVSVSGVSRALTHQLVRHRLFSYLQQSQRAVEIDVDSDWYATPDSIRKSIYAEEYDQLMERIEIFYGKLTKTAIKDEDTRFVLPNATKTHITIKGNARNWLHFFKMRLDPHAQWEIREMAQKILEEFMKLSPIIFEGAGELEV